MLSREQHLSFCKRCIKRRFDPAKGIVCGLTDEYADFEEQCPDFEEDPKAAIHERRAEEHRKFIEKDETPDLMILALEGKIIAGAVLAIAGAVWFAIGLYYKRIAGFALLLFGVGVYGIVRGMLDRRNKRSKHQDDIIDTDLD